MGRELRKRANLGESREVTVSIGRSAHGSGERPRPLIEPADDCLYEAKVCKVGNHMGGSPFTGWLYGFRMGQSRLISVSLDAANA